MKSLILLLLILSFPIYAKDTVVLKGHYFEGDKSSVEFMKGNEVSKFKKKESLLHDRESREKIFKEAGVIDEIKGMDELDRDLFFYKLKNNDLEELKKEYPLVSTEKIKKLKKILVK